jgi:hypothetical protein
MVAAIASVLVNQTDASGQLLGSPPKCAPKTGRALMQLVAADVIARAYVKHWKEKGRESSSTPTAL